MSDDFLKIWDPEVHNCYSVVIADMGMGRECDLEMTEGAGTPLYRAPECDDGYYDKSADVLSLGIIFYELLFGEPIFTQRKARNLAGKLYESTNIYRFKKTLEIHRRI